MIIILTKNEGEQKIDDSKSILLTELSKGGKQRDHEDNVGVGFKSYGENTKREDLFRRKAAASKLKY